MEKVNFHNFLLNFLKELCQSEKAEQETTNRGVKSALNGTAPESCVVNAQVLPSQVHLPQGKGLSCVSELLFLTFEMNH